MTDLTDLTDQEALQFWGSVGVDHSAKDPYFQGHMSSVGHEKIAELIGLGWTVTPPRYFAQGSPTTPNLWYVLDRQRPESKPVATYISHSSPEAAAVDEAKRLNAGEYGSGDSKVGQSSHLTDRQVVQMWISPYSNPDIGAMLSGPIDIARRKADQLLADGWTIKPPPPRYSVLETDSGDYLVCDIQREDSDFLALHRREAQPDARYEAELQVERLNEQDRA